MKRYIYIYLFAIISFGVATPTLASFSPPKNVIIMIGDGMAFNQVQAGSLYNYGLTDGQSYHDFPVTIASATYGSSGSYDPDLAWASFDYFETGFVESAASATAISSGTKTTANKIGIDADGNELKHATERAQELGKATGVVTTVEISHATPAGFSAHNASRNNYSAIAQEMISDSNMNVIMGAGHPLYDNDGSAAAANYTYVGGQTLWDSLVAGTAGGATPWALIQTKTEFTNLITDPSPPTRLIGIAQVRDTLQQERDSDTSANPYNVPLNSGVPTLAQMAQGALNVLAQDEDGLMVMIEGGAIDWTGHDNQKGRLIEEQIDFDDAVEAVIDWVEANSNWDETLLIVTGYHETGYLWGLDSSGTTWNALGNAGEGSVPNMSWYTTGHTNSLVPLYAKGTGSDQFTDYVEDTDSVRGDYVHSTAVGQIIFSLYSNPDLASISLGAGSLSPAFSVDVTSYTAVLPYGTTEAPAVTAVADDDLAAVAVSNASALPGTTSVQVTGEDDTITKTYNISFSVATDTTR